VKADSNSTTDNTNICDKSIDSDCDGLTNAEEKLYGTDPNNPDTDGDGYSDGVEVKSGYDPLKPAPGDKIATEKILLQFLIKPMLLMLILQHSLIIICKILVLLFIKRRSISFNS